MKRTRFAIFFLTASLTAGVPALAGASSRDLYTRTLARERVLRDARSTPTLKQLRAVVAAYDRLVRRFPASGYSDNALWQAGNLALLAYDRFGDEADRDTGRRLLERLKTEYPSSSLAARVDGVLAEVRMPAGAHGRSEAEPAARSPAPVDAIAEADRTPSRSPSAGEKGPAPGSKIVTIRDIKRTPVADGIRITVEMDGESLFRQERVENPQRVFFDLRGTRAAAGLQDGRLRFSDDVIREIRLGRHPQNTTRIAMDLEGVDSYSVFTLYNPFRLVIDFRRTSATAAAAGTIGTASEPSPPPLAPGVSTADTPPPVSIPVPPAELRTLPPVEKVPLRSRQPGAPVAAPPAVPSTNSNGQFSLARQLGLGVSRVVLDAGHGGHDPGAQANGIVEAELVLDVAQRLRKLLEKHAGIEVTMTRDSDTFIPLEERTAIANREAADLFLSIHANASRNTRARGIETYFLNFSSNPEAEAVAARENSASGRTMHNLPDIVKAIALNNKIDESRDFASTVQNSMVKRLSTRNRQLKDLGVKQAPFVVLIGAGMPSVLAEISFVTNRQESQMLRTGPYRQQIAEALYDAIVRYQQSLKKMTAVAATTRSGR